jgi:predicted deacylase
MFSSRRLSLALITVFTLGLSSWASGEEPVFSSYYVDGEDKALIRLLAERFDLERKRGDGFEVMVRRDKASELLKLAPHAALLEKDVQDVFRRMDRQDPEWRRAYHDWNSVQSTLKDIALKYPHFAALENYGSSQDGRPLLVLRLTSPTMSEKPEILVTSSTHGDELATVELSMTVIDKMVKGFGTDPRITQILDSRVVYFIPVVCPDGYVRHTRHTNGLDPNRDYPWPGNPSKKSNAALEAEMAWVAKHKIVGGLDIHSNLATVMYPWAYTSQRPDPVDEAKFKAISRAMAQDTGYNDGQIVDVFGVAKGSSADYWYWKHRSISLGYEMGGAFLPASRDLPRAFDRDTQAILRFIESF